MAMISTILILILERTNMIGVLKALGSRNASIRRIFIFNAMFIIGKGMLYGNLVGIGLCLVQQYTGLIPLPQESYFMSVVPVNLQITHLLILNLGTLAVCTLMMIVPSLIVARISPVKAIRFD
jgi:lipoprotein-releasing system permease protein